MEEIVVTARKREESLMDAPLSVSAFSGAKLDFLGVSNIERLGQFSPNFVLSKSPTNSGVSNVAVYIRGIGQNDFVPVIDPGVGIYVDGVYLGRSVGAALDLIDVERVEILRGPQGTLFGRNTIGGAITLTMLKPNEEFGGKADIKFGTDNLLNARGTLNLPVSDTFFTRFSVATFNQHGYVTRGDGQDLGNDDTVAARAAARWVPTEQLEVNLSFDYSRDRENGPPLLNTGIQPLNVGIFNPGGAPSMVLVQNTIVAQAATPGGIYPGSGPYFDPTAPFPFNPVACFSPGSDTNSQCYNQQYIDDGTKKYNYGTGPSYADLDVWGAALTIDRVVDDNLKVKSITAYRSQDGDFAADTDASPLTMGEVADHFDQDQFSQELQLLGTSFDSRLDWILGLYYFHEDGANPDHGEFTSVYLQSGGYFKSHSWALFGQGTWHITEQLDLTAGLRYSKDKRSYLPDQFIEALPIGPLPGVNCPPGEPGSPPCAVGDRIVPYEEVSTDSGEVLPMVNLAYHWSDTLLSYFTYARGYKSGGFTQRIFPPEPTLPSFEPEYVNSYELGSKYTGWDDRLRLSLAVFHMDYTDMQLLVADPSRLGPFVSNAGDAEIKGVEMELEMIPAPGWHIAATLGLTDPKRTALGGGVQGLTLYSRFEHISKWTANAQLYKVFSIDSYGQLTPLIEWAYRSKYGTNSNNVPRDGAPTGPAGTPLAGVPLSFGVANPALLQDGLNLFNASIRWDIGSTGFSAAGGVDNLTDRKYRTFGSYEDSFGWTTEVFDRGRQWYVQLSYEL
ncbi:MAG TPA: TonB-dependent receptor [Xanthomonadales bacterium]|nr:TonB-dependent receptor [Xanthomonadales bacterium]